MNSQNPDREKLRKQLYEFYLDFNRYYTTNAYFQLISQMHPDRFTVYILDRIKPDDVFLEVGSGSGVMVMEAARLSKMSVGADISPAACRLASGLAKTERDRYRLIEDIDNISLNSDAMVSRTAFVPADAERLPFKDNSFDVCICRDALEHIVNWEDALKDMKRCLRPGGSIMLVIPISKRIDFNIDREEWDKHHGAMSDRDAVNRIRWNRIFAWARSNDMKIVHRVVRYRYKWIGKACGLIGTVFPALEDAGILRFAERNVFVHMEKPGQ